MSVLWNIYYSRIVGIRCRVNKVFVEAVFAPFGVLRLIQENDSGLRTVDDSNISGWSSDSTVNVSCLLVE